MELCIDAKAILAEGPLWHPEQQVLYWVDIEGRQLHRYDAITGIDESFEMEARIGTVVPAAGGGLVVALQTGIYHFDWVTSATRLITQPLTNPAIRFNDGKCDAAGCLWVGSMHVDAHKEAGTLYRVNRRGEAAAMLNGISISNGMGWTADHKTMYFIDTPTQRVMAFEVDETINQLTNGRVVIEVPEQMGAPDGMTVDVQGNIWIALWGGYAVGCWDPLTGRLLAKIDVPVPHVSSCTFGGPELDRLYITTAREGLDAPALARFPQSGGVYMTRPGVRGMPAFEMKE